MFPTVYFRMSKAEMKREWEQWQPNAFWKMAVEFSIAPCIPSRLYLSSSSAFMPRGAIAAIVSSVVLRVSHSHRTEGRHVFLQVLGRMKTKRVYCSHWRRVAKTPQTGNHPLIYRPATLSALPDYRLPLSNSLNSVFGGTWETRPSHAKLLLEHHYL